MATQEIRELERTIPFETNGNGLGNPALNFAVLHWIGASGSLAPAYWSQSRDIWLRRFYEESDYLGIAASTFVEKAVGVPLTIMPADHTVKAHTEMAEQLYDDLMRNSGMLKGFEVELGKFVQDYLTQDNGAYFLVMGGGKADGPIVGPAIGVMHLDSQFCTRTGQVEYPVIYDDEDGKRYKLHYTRVIFMSSMPSGKRDLCGVGRCAVTRTIHAAQNLLNIAIYNEEKLGSRPARQILYAKKGSTLPQMEKAILAASTKLDAMGLERFARTLIMAPPQGQELELEVLDLASVPDGFDREKATILDVAVISAAFGLDMRDLAHSFGVAGQTKADAEVMHKKTIHKGVSGFLESLAKQFMQKLLPKTLECYFDYVDDTQDEHAATIRKLRAEGRQIDLAAGAITVRIAREQMLEDQEITEQQFEDMELADGRLADGMDVLMLFQSQDTEIQRILGGVVENPLEMPTPAQPSATSTPPANINAIIDERIRLAWERHDTAPNANIKRKMRQAIAALNKLRTAQTPSEPQTQPAQPDEEQPAEDEDEPEFAKALRTKQDEILDGLMGRYQDDLDNLTERAVSGEIDQETFEEEMAAIVAALLLAAFLRGSRRSEEDLTAELRARVNQEIAVNLDAIGGYASDIYAGRYGPERLGPEGAERRNQLWVGALGAMYGLGQTRQRNASRVYLQWNLGATEQHCGTCSRLNGQVHTAEEWAESGWYPKASHLDCHGFHCLCYFMQVSGPSQGGF